MQKTEKLIIYRYDEHKKAFLKPAVYESDLALNAINTETPVLSYKQR